MAGFHDGELAVQRRAGVRGDAARLTGMLAAPKLDGGVRLALAGHDFAVITGRGHGRRLWTSPLFADPGFLDTHDTVLAVHAAPQRGDPLSEMTTPQPVGLLAIDFVTRRRIRVNGTLIDAAAHQLVIAVDQAYGNCPKYIQQRELQHHEQIPAAAPPSYRNTLSSRESQQIAAADTLFLGTVHPTRGADASHRGGPPGFVRVDGKTLWWPDYVGNNMFNSFGNLAVDNTAALLFIDFATGSVLHLSGSAVVEWTRPGIRGDDGGTGRRVIFSIDRVATGLTLDVGSDLPRPSSYNPPLT